MTKKNFIYVGLLLAMGLGIVTTVLGYKEQTAAQKIQKSPIALNTITAQEAITPTVVDLKASPNIRFFNKGKFEYSADVLADPDKVIEAYLDGTKNCGHLLLPQEIKYTLYPLTEQPYITTKNGIPLPLRLSEQVHPEKAIRDLYEKYGALLKAVEPRSGYYREYKIIDKKPYPKIGGLETIEYTAEVLYVYFEWPSEIEGYPEEYTSLFIPSCERNIIKLYLLKKDTGWYAALFSGKGDSIQAIRARLLEKYPKSAQEDIKEINAIAAQCKDSFN